MSFHVKTSGAWGDIVVPEYKKRLLEDPRLINGGWTRVSGEWKKFFTLGDFPSNYIHLYLANYSVPASATPLDSLYDYFPLMTTNSSLVGTTTGSNTHDGVDHGGATSITVSTYSHPQCKDRDLAPNGDPCGNSSHSHGTTTEFVSHDHDGEVSNIPPHLNIVPAVCSYGSKNEVFLYSGTGSIPSGYSLYSGENDLYLRFASNFGTGGSATHIHVEESPYLDTFSASVISNQSYLRDVYWYRYHNHYLQHSHSGDNDPPYINLSLIRPNSVIHSFAKLPANTIGLFTSSTLPEGWISYTAADNRIPKHITVLSSVGSTGGSSSHTHTLDGAITSGMQNSATRYEIENDSGRYKISSHTHTVTHSHSVAVSNVPLSKYVYVGIYLPQSQLIFEDNFLAIDGEGNSLITRG